MPIALAIFETKQYKESTWELQVRVLLPIKRHYKPQLIRTIVVPAMVTPFTFNFLTDAWTMAVATTIFKGFKLTYFETTC